MLKFLILLLKYSISQSIYLKHLFLFKKIVFLISSCLKKLYFKYTTHKNNSLQYLININVIKLNNFLLLSVSYIF